MKLRNVTRLLEPGKLESEEYIPVEEAPETLLVQVVARKK
jgi:hypothetical protein